MKPRLTVSVRHLVDLFLRSGDLEFGFSGPQRALEGIRIHRKLRDERPQDYLAEQAVKLEIDRPELVLEVSGRIDGVFWVDGKTVVEEIKSTYTSPAKLLRQPDPRHWGQARCYAYMWACKHDLAAIEVRLTYWHLPTSSSHVYARTLTTEDLARFFHSLVKRYCRWLSCQMAWQARRDASILSMVFPFDTFRSGQREMAVAVYRTISGGGRIMIEAPTGIGKTMAVLFAAIKSMAEGATTKIFFLTARTTGRLAAEKALRQLRGQGLILRSLSLTAKEKLCPEPGKNCLADQCPYAVGYYERLPRALDAAWEKHAVDRKVLESLAVSWQVCPFALSMELVQSADCVICDYNYVFDPRVALRWLMSDGEAGGFTLLVDEAHNLVERGREMFSARISKESLLELRRRVKGYLPGIYRALTRVNAWLAGVRRQSAARGGSMVAKELPAGLLERLDDFCRRAEDWLVLNRPADYRGRLQELYFEAAAFVRTARQFDHTYRLIYQTDGDRLQVRLFCMDAAGRLAPVWNSFRAAVLFSATMIPLDYFRRLLGLPSKVPSMRLDSPFPAQNFQLLVAHHVSTYYQQRQASCRQVVALIKALADARPGNYLVFFPSYQYLEMVFDRLVQAGLDAQILKQEPAMDAVQKDNFLKHFDEPPSRTLLALAVVGGVFGEGIDLVGERLSGAVIIGVGLPAICPERELIREYHDRRGEPGFDYAYGYPGIIRVLQAAGRVIRSETDRGLVLLVDQRYIRPKYRAILEDRWQPLWIRSGPELESIFLGPKRKGRIR